MTCRRTSSAHAFCVDLWIRTHIYPSKSHVPQLLGSTGEHREEGFAYGSRIVKKDNSQLVLVDRCTKLICRLEFLYSHSFFLSQRERTPFQRGASLLSHRLYARSPSHIWVGQKSWSRIDPALVGSRAAWHLLPLLEIATRELLSLPHAVNSLTESKE
jgi:hypothetical protein